MNDPMFDFNIGKRDIFIKVYPAWLYIGYFSNTIMIDCGFICISCSFSIGLDISEWE
jgi:hypothetical protein